MGKRILLVVLVGLLLAVLIVGVVVAQSSASFDLSWHVLAGGGGKSASTHYAMNGTLGQAIVGFSESGSYGTQTGYWQIWPDYRIYLPLVLSNAP
jgi:hypothetical protein